MLDCTGVVSVQGVVIMGTSNDCLGVRPGYEAMPDRTGVMNVQGVVIMGTSNDCSGVRPGLRGNIQLYRGNESSGVMTAWGCGAA